jgi:hypothetical protein
MHAAAQHSTPALKIARAASPKNATNPRREPTTCDDIIPFRMLARTDQLLWLAR